MSLNQRVYLPLSVAEITAAPKVFPHRYGFGVTPQLCAYYYLPPPAQLRGESRDLAEELALFAASQVSLWRQRHSPHPRRVVAVGQAQIQLPTKSEVIPATPEQESQDSAWEEILAICHFVPKPWEGLIRGVVRVPQGLAASRVFSYHLDEPAAEPLLQDILHQTWQIDREYAGERHLDVTPSHLEAEEGIEVARHSQQPNRDSEGVLAAGEIPCSDSGVKPELAAELPEGMDEFPDLLWFDASELALVQEFLSIPAD